MQIPQERLERYSHFVSQNSTNGQYDPEKGLEALLSSLTPDSKIIVLRAMAANRNQWFFTETELHQAVLREIMAIGLPQNSYPLTSKSTWNYCERLDTGGNKIDGSLVDIGAVVKQAEMQTAMGPKTGYQISSTGIELSLPLGLGAIEFVWQAAHSGSEHNYDSMFKLLSTITSATLHRRQLAVFYIVQYLVENDNSPLRFIDIKKALGDKVSQQTLSGVLNSLGQAGIIDYESPNRDIDGHRAKGYVFYALSEKFKPIQNFDNEIVFTEVRKKIPYFGNKGYLSQILHLIESDPSAVYESNNIAQALGLDKTDAIKILSFLEKIGILKRVSNFKGVELLSIARENILTGLFYQYVLQPAWSLATTLVPIPEIGIWPEKIKFFIDNYSVERSYIGPRGGEEVREKILRALEDGTELKMSYLAQRVRKTMERNLKTSSIGDQADKLVKQGKIIKTRKGYYKLVH